MPLDVDSNQQFTLFYAIMIFSNWMKTPYKNAKHIFKWRRSILIFNFQTWYFAKTEIQSTWIREGVDINPKIILQVSSPNTRNHPKRRKQTIFYQGYRINVTLKYHNRE